MAESGLEGYGGDPAVADGSFGIAKGEQIRSILGFNLRTRNTHTFAHPSMMIV